MELTYDIVIVGTGHGAAQAAISLRQNNFGGSICMIGKEAYPPYERPPLSKEYLAREKSFERIMIRPPSFWSERQIDLLLASEVVAVDAKKKRLTLSDGGELGYGELVWSAGGTPRLLTCAGADLSGVHSVRDRSDVDRIMSELDAGSRRAVVIGGGFIGLEAAAVLRSLGCEVILVEALDRVLARVSGEALSRFYEREHISRGVDIRLSTNVECLEGSDGRLTGVRLADGTVLACDIAIVGIGIDPMVRPLLSAGARGSNGVEVDPNCHTSLPSIYAIGDCALHSNKFAGGALVRLESVQNAHDMAMVAAKNLCGIEREYDAVPWFWSNQYDLKLQTVGLSHGHDDIVMRGNPKTRSFSLIYLNKGRVIALDCVNAVRDYVQGRYLVEEGGEYSPDLLSDTSMPLRNLHGIRQIGA